MTRAARPLLAPGVAQIERQLRAIDRKADALKSTGLRNEWLHQQGEKLHAERERLQSAFDAQRAAEAGWQFGAPK